MRTRNVTFLDVEAVPRRVPMYTGRAISLAPGRVVRRDRSPGIADVARYDGQQPGADRASVRVVLMHRNGHYCRCRLIEHHSMTITWTGLETSCRFPVFSIRFVPKCRCAVKQLLAVFKKRLKNHLVNRCFFQSLVVSSFLETAIVLTYLFTCLLTYSLSLKRLELDMGQFLLT